ncbi:anti-sigma factor [Amycolatopsis sp. cmx-11-32]|uniref:anti-sigma factor n=1 Tax=Amycolatopsis sp. cmx-11-32 TaxID=2785796 RepID=UPI0039E362FF
MRKRKAKHTDVAAFALGVFDQSEAYVFEEHLKGCGRRGRQVAEFASVEAALAKADPRYLSPGAARRRGRLSRITANLVVVLLICVVAAVMSSHRSSGR